MAIGFTAEVSKSFVRTLAATHAEEWERFRERRQMGKVLREAAQQPGNLQMVANGSVHVPEAGKKFDSGKAPVAQGFDAYFPLAKAAVANVSRFGKEKYKVEYSDKNWMRVEGAAGRYEDALGRHSDAHLSGELYAEDSRLLHAAHRAWNAMATLELLLRSGVKERQE
jgi:hypothetical protein